MFDSTTLVSVSGNVKDAQFEGVFLEWEVGCGNVQAYHMPILQTLETSFRDGSMSKAVGHVVVGWHVTNNRPPTPHRFKRQARIYPTPGPRRTRALREYLEYEDEYSGFWESTPEPTRVPETPTESATATRKSITMRRQPINRKPEVRNPIEKQDVTVGEIFELRVPRNTFYDQEDGNTRRMTIFMLTSDRLALPIDSWVKFYKSMQIMRGLPLSEQAGLYKYLMYAMDSNANIGEIYLRSRCTHALFTASR